MRKVAELPPTSAGRYQRQPDAAHMVIVKQLLKEPGTWYEVKSFNTESAANRFAAGIRHNRFIAFRDGRWEAQVRGLTVHARALP